MSYCAFVVAYLKQAPTWTWIPLTAFTAFFSLLTARTILLLMEHWQDRSPGQKSVYAHWVNVIGRYDERTRATLREYYVTGNHRLVPSDLQTKFYDDGLLTAGTGHIMQDQNMILKILNKLSK